MKKLLPKGNSRHHQLESESILSQKLIDDKENTVFVV